MSNDDSQRDQRDAAEPDLDTGDLEVSREKADEVTGGLNPQPLPPIVQDSLNPQPLPPIVR